MSLDPAELALGSQQARHAPPPHVAVTIIVSPPSIMITGKWQRHCRRGRPRRQFSCMMKIVKSPVPFP